MEDLNVDQLTEHLKTLFSGAETLTVQAINHGCEISYGAMYRAPALSYSLLLDLSKLFGTNSIDVDNYSVTGCDTCDYGSDYGHSIQIRHITKNLAALTQLAGKDLLSGK